MVAQLQAPKARPTCTPDLGKSAIQRHERRTTEKSAALQRLATDSPCNDTQQAYGKPNELLSSVDMGGHCRSYRSREPEETGCGDRFRDPSGEAPDVVLNPNWSFGRRDDLKADVRSSWWTIDSLEKRITRPDNQQARLQCRVHRSADRFPGS